uniref:Insulin-like growth factor 1 receptor (inferred by orthology to a human protein) n=1 Tax=Strongyloides venezuelensis TaxID=75913 RepID=A0A0K0FRV4_STRVS
MSFLESYKFCHIDLAARNCLVHRDEIVEIGDFDMARYIYYQEYYQPTDNPEVFEYNVKPRKILSGLQGCADLRHHTMKHFWRYNPSNRPSFFQIFTCLELHTAGDFKQQSFVLTNYEKLKMNITWKHNEDEKKEEIKEVHNHDGKEDGRVDDDEEDDENENKNESDIGNHFEVIDEDDKSENVFLARPKKHVRIPTPDNNA